MAEKKTYPDATKTKMIKLLRDKGCDIPSVRQAAFTKVNYSFWLRWKDSKGKEHAAYYTGSAGRPVLQIDTAWVPFTLAQAQEYEMVKEK